MPPAGRQASARRRVQARGAGEARSVAHLDGHGCRCRSWAVFYLQLCPANVKRVLTPVLMTAHIGHGGTFNLTNSDNNKPQSQSNLRPFEDESSLAVRRQHPDRTPQPHSMKRIDR